MSIQKNFFAPLALGLCATRRAAMLLLVMMLTATAAWAETKTITYSLWYDGVFSIKGNNGDNYSLGDKVGYLPKTFSITFPDVTITITSSGDNVQIAQYYGDGSIGFSGFDYTFQFESSKYYISHLRLSGYSNVNDIDNNTKSCTGTWLNTYGLANVFEVTLTDTKPTHYYDITYELGNGTNDVATLRSTKCQRVSLRSTMPHAQAITSTDGSAIRI